MKKKRDFKLLSKTAIFYLLFTLIAFVAIALFLTHEVNQFVYFETEHDFRKTAEQISRELNRRRDFDRFSPNIQVTPIEWGSIDPEQYPIYNDTTVYVSFLDETHRARQKVVLLREDRQLYEVSMIINIEDYARFRDDIFETMLPAFIILASGIVLFNYLMSGYFFRPFNKILAAMKSYQIGRNSDIPAVKTTTREFNKMQSLFHQMVERIEYDYQHLKEYTENMAHEIQTPLAIIRNKTENLIGDEPVMGQHEASIKTIYEETNHLSRLGNTLNLITKIENGEFDDIRQITTKPVIEKHAEAISELARLKSLSIQCDLEDEHYLMIDPYLLDIVLKNLLRNAVSYGTGDGPIRINTTKNSLSISNYGEPIDIPEQRLFERFYSNGNTRGSSLGLGLSLVAKICEISNLDIRYKYQDDQHIFIIEPMEKEN